MADQADGPGCESAVDPPPLVTVRRSFQTRYAVGGWLSLDCFAAEHSSPHMSSCRVSQCGHAVAQRKENHARQIRDAHCRWNRSLLRSQKLDRDEPEDNCRRDQCLLAKRRAGDAKIVMPGVCQRVGYERCARHGEKK